ncbi:MAG: hypothetical protein JNL11_13075 [Bdellovibrionaceae bacterium]|nr:hypothetical protein [Pseudobdellovibrionaceae bacterium]
MIKKTTSETTNQMMVTKKIYNSLFLRLLLCISLFSSTVFSAPDVLFEGYHKVFIGKQHVGYTITRYEFDPKDKKFFCTIFVKFGALAGNVMESVKAVSDQNLVPISYEYTTLVTENNKPVTKNIQASFKLNKLTKKERDKIQKTLKKGETAPTEVLKMTANVNENGKITKHIDDLPKGTFLSYFLVYLMLKSKSGIQTDSRYQYEAIAEEKPKLVEGVAIVRNEEDFMGVKTYKIENTFNNQKFISYVTDKGHVIGVVNPSQSVETELVGKPAQAVGEFNLPTTVLKSLFGDVPLGVTNIVSAKLQADALKPVTEPAGSKQYGAPAGKGIQTKIPEPTVETIQKPIPNPTEKVKGK